VPEKHRKRVGAEHRRSRPHKFHALTVDHRCCRPCRDEVAAAPVNPRQDHSCIRHPATIVVPVDDRMNDLDVALDGDDDQAEDGTVRGNGHYRVGLEQETDDPLAGCRGRLEPAKDHREYEKEAGQKIKNGLVHDEDVDILSTTLAGAEQHQQDEAVGD